MASIFLSANHNPVALKGKLSRCPGLTPNVYGMAWETWRNCKRLDQNIMRIKLPKGFDRGVANEEERKQLLLRSSIYIYILL